VALLARSPIRFAPALSAAPLPRQIRFSSRLACQVGSHKDSAGSAAANQKLYGQNRPVADYDTEKKRVQNRGIEFTTVN